MNTTYADNSILDRLLDPVGRILTPEVARKLANLRLDAAAQARIDKLARKCNEGPRPSHSLMTVGDWPKGG